ncbi:MAG: hypothetical protein F7C36_00885 [Desulfurococcales archaeon]|nr:hypothetical protein [Desulfurococcales archaeon]
MVEYIRKIVGIILIALGAIPGSIVIQSIPALLENIYNPFYTIILGIIILVVDSILAIGSMSLITIGASMLKDTTW